MSEQHESNPTEEPRRSYVYYSYEEWGKGYIGSRTRKGCYPGDAYLGSFSDATFHPIDKIILFEGTTEECLEVEVLLHDFYDVGRNPHFANKAKQTSTGFNAGGRVSTPEQIENYKNAWDDERRKKTGEWRAKQNKNPSENWKNSNRVVRRKHFTREVWNDVETALLTHKGGCHWGKQKIIDKHGVSEKTLRKMKKLIEEGLSFDEVIQGKTYSA